MYDRGGGAGAGELDVACEGEAIALRNQSPVLGKRFASGDDKGHILRGGRTRASTLRVSP